MIKTFRFNAVVKNHKGFSFSTRHATPLVGRSLLYCYLLRKVRGQGPGMSSFCGRKYTSCHRSLTFCKRVVIWVGMFCHTQRSLLFSPSDVSYSVPWKWLWHQRYSDVNTESVQESIKIIVCYSDEVSHRKAHKYLRLQCGLREYKLTSFEECTVYYSYVKSYYNLRYACFPTLFFMTFPNHCFFC
jgi:hypothetical protein